MAVADQPNLLWMNESMIRLERELVGKYGPSRKAQVDRGLHQVMEYWRPQDGDGTVFEAFIRANFAGDQTAKDLVARQLVQSVCSTCHTLERVETSRFTEDKWRDVVTDMKAKGARIEDADIAPLAGYLTRTYSPSN